MAIRWVDRVPTRANRVLVTPENGGTPYYATITRADEPSVVGTPVNAANLNAMQEAAGLTGHRAIYVATTGSDNVGDGSQANPYATISKAVSTIPVNLNGYTARIYIAAGTYTENVTVQNFGNGIIGFSGNSGDVVTITGEFKITNVKYMEVFNISLNLVGSSFSVVGSKVSVHSKFSASDNYRAIYADQGSSVTFLNTVTVNNATAAENSIAVVATYGSNVYVDTLMGENLVAFASTRGAVCSYGADESTSTSAKFYTERGGRIYTGAQTSAPNY